MDYTEQNEEFSLLLFQEAKLRNVELASKTMSKAEAVNAVVAMHRLMMSKENIANHLIATHPQELKRG